MLLTLPSEGAQHSSSSTLIIPPFIYNQFHDFDVLKDYNVDLRWCSSAHKVLVPKRGSACAGTQSPADSICMELPIVDYNRPFPLA